MRNLRNNRNYADYNKKELKKKPKFVIQKTKLMKYCPIRLFN